MSKQANHAYTNSPPNMPLAIKVKGLKKSFPKVEAVSDISFSINKGELFGFLGPNGAGKTTTINMLTGLARPDSGTIEIAGIDCTKKPRAAQNLIGVVPDESNLYPELTGFENLCFCASLYGLSKNHRIQKAQKLLKDFGLEKAQNRKFGGYSKGMKRKLTIAAGIIHEPEILFLDEPTTGIDVASAMQLRGLIAELRQAGTTVFLTTHYIEEAERLCDRIAFLVSGRILKIDTVENLVQPIKAKHVLQIAFANSIENVLSQISLEFPEFEFTSPEKGIISIKADNPIGVGPLVRFLEDMNAEVLEARKIRPSLEEVFVKITGLKVKAMRQEKEKKGGAK